MPVGREAFGGTALDIALTGLLGGHSGAEIDKGRANPNLLMGRLLYALGKAADMRLVSVRGGLKDNAIPTASYASVIVRDAETARAVCAAMETAFRNEYRVTDAGISVTVTPGADSTPMDKASTARIVTLLCCAPNGIQEMSADIPGLVQTSLNLGILTTDRDGVHATFSVRSSIDSQKRMLIDRLTALTESLGGGGDGRWGLPRLGVCSRLSPARAYARCVHRAVRARAGHRGDTRGGLNAGC